MSHRMKWAKDNAEQIQELLDEGRSVAYIASLLKVHHEIVRRAIEKEKLEIYIAFDETETKAIQDYSDLDFEDVLDGWDRDAWSGKEVILPNTAGREDIFTKQLLTYIRDKYGSLKDWARDKKGYSDNLRTHCSSCEKAIPVTSFSLRNGSLNGIEGSCSKCNYNPDKRYHLIYSNRRRTAKTNFPEKWSAEDRSIVREAFNNVCAITLSDICDDDHFIPLSIGHGGSFVGNMYPLDSSLNSSKKAKNPFEWFAANAERFNLDPSRFEALVAKLAEQNGLTPEDFREYTYWCFANPRDLTQIKRDNARYGYRVNSVELWREATGSSSETGNRLNSVI